MQRYIPTYYRLRLKEPLIAQGSHHRGSLPFLRPPCPITCCAIGKAERHFRGRLSIVTADTEPVYLNPYSGIIPGRIWCECQNDSTVADEALLQILTK